jgi:gluconokinase
MGLNADHRSVVVMGVSGSGKSTIAMALSKRLGGEFLDADSLHSPENIAKMASGEALSDDDRWPWLKLVGERIKDYEEGHLSSFTACSALKRSYRDALRVVVLDLFFVFLDGSPAVIEKRIEVRASGYMPSSLLASQFATLEPLQPDERGLRLDANESPNEIVSLIVSQLSATT